MKNFYRRGMLIIMFLLALGILVILAMSQAKAATASFKFPTSFQQEVTGQVTGTNGQPLMGVTISLKNRGVGTTTGRNGNYAITTQSGDTLVFSFIGYQKQEVPVGNRATIDIVLEEDIAAFSEVEINAGYYTVKERERTGNISRVTAEEIENQPVVSPIQALQGRMAGVEVTSGGSHPGAAPTIRIRGTNSLREEGNYPLYIIDGVPINSTPVETNSLIGNAGIDPLNNLNMSNIESIEILKDADATAIYGSRGANGVVLITTKKGKAGTGLEASFYTGAAKVPNRLDLLKTQDYLSIRRAAFENDEVEPTAANAFDLVVWDQQRYTDWQDFLFGGNAEVTKADITYTGGGNHTQFRIGGSYFNQGTIYPADYNYQRGTGNFSLNHSSEDQKFRLNFSIIYGVDRNNLVGNLNLDSSIGLLPPNAPELFNEDNTLNWEDWAAVGRANPFEGYYNESITNTKNLISSSTITYELTTGLSIKSNLGYTSYKSDELWKMPGRSYNPATNPINNSFHLENNRESWILEPQLVYDNNFGKLGTHFILGGTFQDNKTTQQNFQGTGYASEALIGNLAAAESILNPRNSNTNYRYAAIFSRLGLDWDKKYYLNFTGRRDGSSRFGPNNKFASFGAIGAAWIFSNESFIQDHLAFISFGKLRGSYGTTGNDQIGDYGYLDSYQATRGTGGLYPTELANPNFSWEVNKKLEAGIEVGLWNEDFNLGLSWYRNRSSNQLVGYALPATTGFNSVQANLPATVQNSGVEIELASLLVSNENFSWRTSANLSIPENELVAYPGLDQSSYANTYRVGYPLNIVLQYEYTGLDPDTGFYTFSDVNEDDLLNFEDRVLVQDRSREFFGGINNELAFKNISLRFLWQFVKQSGQLNYYNAGQPLNILETTLDNSRFQRPSQSFTANRAYLDALNSDLFYQDASFLRLKTLFLSYDLPDAFLNRIGLKQCQLFINGQNLLTITPYDGIDPDSPYEGMSTGNLLTVTGGIQLNL